MSIEQSPTQVFIRRFHVGEVAKQVPDDVLERGVRRFGVP